MLAWERPFFHVEVCLLGGDWVLIDVPRLLAQTGMAGAVREAVRLCAENQVWLDDGIAHPLALPVREKDESKRWERLRRIGRDLEDGRFWLFEPGDCLAVGKTPMEACAHVIEFV